MNLIIIIKKGNQYIYLFHNQIENAIDNNLKAHPLKYKMFTK